MNTYNLSRTFFNWSYENYHKVKPVHIALYFAIIERFNRLGWKDSIGLPAYDTMEMIGVKSYHTFKEALDDLINFGFINMIEKSKNQHTANVIALSNFAKATDKAGTKALDKATSMHDTKQGQSTVQSNCTIVKQINKEQPNKEEEGEPTPTLKPIDTFQPTPENLESLKQQALMKGVSKIEIEAFISKMESDSWLEVKQGHRFEFKDLNHVFKKLWFWHQNGVLKSIAKDFEKNQSFANDNEPEEMYEFDPETWSAKN